VVHFSDLNCIISEEIMNDEWKIVKASEEAEDASIVVQELLLALHSSTTKRFLHIFLEARVSELGFRNLSFSKAILWG
jgi:hypothetical protein